MDFVWSTLSVELPEVNLGSTIRPAVDVDVLRFPRGMPMSRSEGETWNGLFERLHHSPAATR